MSTRPANSKVSIGMPVYNGERFIRETLDSLLSQTFTDFDLIISDNASTDGTQDSCRDYSAKDSRIRYYRNSENIGASRNYRRVFELSSGAYFRWANHDDLFAPESLARCVEVLDSHPSVVLVYPKTRLIDQSGHVISDYDDGLHLQASQASERFAQAWARLGLVNVIYGLIRRSVIEKTALMGDFIGSDIPFVTELTLYGKFFEISDFLFYRRIHPNAHSSHKDTSQLFQFYRPNKQNSFALTTCRQMCAAIRAVKRAPLRRAEKLRLARHVARMIRWNRWQIATDLLAAVKQLTQSADRRRKSDSIPERSST